MFAPGNTQLPDLLESAYCLLSAIVDGPVDSSTSFWRDIRVYVDAASSVLTCSGTDMCICFDSI